MHNPDPQGEVRKCGSRAATSKLSRSVYPLYLPPLANVLLLSSDVIQALDHTRQSFSSYLRIRSTASAHDSPELIQSKADLQATLSELSSDLSDLAGSVRVVEVDPYKYGLAIEEVSRRRRFVKEVEGEVEDMVDELRNAVNRQSGGKSIGSGDVDVEGNLQDSYVVWEQEQQQVIMAEQDEVLEGVYRTMGNLREQAHEMGREFQEQTECAKPAYAYVSI